MSKDRSCTDTSAVKNFGGFCGQAAVLQLIHKTSLWNLLDGEQEREFAALVEKTVRTEKVGAEECRALPDAWKTQYAALERLLRESSKTLEDSGSFPDTLIRSFLKAYGGHEAFFIYTNLGRPFGLATGFTSRWYVVEEDERITDMSSAFAVVDETIAEVKKLECGVVLGGILSGPEHGMAFVVCNDDPEKPTYRLFNSGRSMTDQEVRSYFVRIKDNPRASNRVIVQKGEVFCHNNINNVVILIDKQDHAVRLHTTYTDMPLSL